MATEVAGASALAGPSVVFALGGSFSEAWIRTLERVLRSRTFAPNIDASVRTLAGGDLASELQQLSSQTSSDYVVLITQTVKLRSSAFSSFLEGLFSNDSADVTYADSRLQTRPLGSSVIYRPEFSAERLRSQYYFGPIVAYRATALAKISSQVVNRPALLVPWALALAALREKLSFRHDSNQIAVEGARHELEQGYENNVLSMLEEHLDSTGGGRVDAVLTPDLAQTHRQVEGSPLVSIVIPTRAVFADIHGYKKCFVVDAVQSIVKRTDYPHYELLIVVDRDADSEVIETLHHIAGDKVKFIEWTKPFNFSQKMNFGVLHAQGDFVLLLNDDVEVIPPSWLSAMLSLAKRPNAGMVGAMLYYEDESIQHAGHAYFHGSPTHVGLGLPRGSVGKDNLFLIEREVSGVTAACALMPKKVFVEAGGFTPLLPGNFNDVDLCLKVGWLNYDIYWTPFAELYHYESKTRDAHVHYYELDLIQKRWGQRLNDARFWPGHPYK